MTAPTHTTSGAAGPLAGFLVIDISRVLSGPYCTMMLLDLGAEVIKVEQPIVGDEARQFLPFHEGRSAYFASFNRGKKSIALDLKAEADRRIFDRLLARADVLVENFRPGVLDRLGYGFRELEKRYPALVLASISGFGQDGPYRERAAYDVVVQAMSGMMSVTGHPGMPPARAGSSIGDLSAAMFACNGIQAALLQRVRTGRGCHVDVSMFESQIAMLEGAIPAFVATGVSPGPIGARHPGTAPFDAFAAADGHLVIAAGSDHLFRGLCEAVGRPVLADDPRFAHRKSRVANHEVLKQELESMLAGASVAEWLARLERAGIPAGPINDVAALLDDPQVRHRGILPGVRGSEGLRAAVTPVRLSTCDYPAELPPVPELDQHREEILRLAARDAPAPSSRTPS